MTLVRLGFVGTGGIANAHFKRLEAMDDVEIVAVCDLDRKRLRAAAERFGATPYKDAEEMISAGGLDAVYVCTPPFAHAAAEKAAVKRGLPIFVEKPVHLDLAEARSVARAIERKGLVSGAGYQDRYQDIIDRLQDELSSRPPGMVMGYWMGGMPGVAWWRRKEMSGGQHVEQTTHIFDMCRYLFGEVKQVYAQGTRGLMKDVPRYNIEDATAVTLTFRSGLVATVFSACFLGGGTGRSGLDIYSKNCHINYVERRSVTIKEPKSLLTIEVGNDFGFAEDRAFIDAVKSGDSSGIRSTYPDAVRSLELSLAASESMAAGAPVKVRAR